MFDKKTDGACNLKQRARQSDTENRRQQSQQKRKKRVQKGTSSILGTLRNFTHFFPCIFTTAFCVREKYRTIVPTVLQRHPG